MWNIRSSRSSAMFGSIYEGEGVEISKKWENLIQWRIYRTFRKSNQICESVFRCGDMLGYVNTTILAFFSLIIHNLTPFPTFHKYETLIDGVAYCLLTWFKIWNQYLFTNVLNFAKNLEKKSIFDDFFPTARTFRPVRSVQVVRSIFRAHHVTSR